jgi:hypothetical protein
MRLDLNASSLQSPCRRFLKELGVDDNFAITAALENVVFSVTLDLLGCVENECRIARFRLFGREKVEG